MKSMRVWILLLMALLLPLRGLAALGSVSAGLSAHCATMAATQPASAADATTASEPARPATASGHASSSHANPASPTDAAACVAADASSSCDADDGGCATKAGTCPAGCCSALSMAPGWDPGPASLARVTAVFPPVDAPRVGFVTAGLDRPPRDG